MAPSGAFVLAALVEIGHDHIDAAGFSAHGCDHPLQVLEMVVWGHDIFVTAHIISEAIIAYVYHDIEVVAADGFADGPLGLAGAETGDLGADDV